LRVVCAGEWEGLGCGQEKVCLLVGVVGAKKPIPPRAPPPPPLRNLQSAVKQKPIRTRSQVFQRLSALCGAVFY